MRLLGQYFLVVVLLAIEVRAGTTSSWSDLGGAKLDGWSGVQIRRKMDRRLMLSLPGRGDFLITPNGPVGFTSIAFALRTMGLSISNLFMGYVAKCS